MQDLFGDNIKTPKDKKTIKKELELEKKLFDKKVAEYLKEKDRAEVIEYLRTEVTQGNKFAIFHLASLLYKRNVEDPHFDDLEEVINLFRTLARKGDVVAQYYLAEIFFNHQYTNEMMLEGFKWAFKASEKGYKNADILLQRVYEDMSEWSLYMFSKEGIPWAQLELANKYKSHGETEAAYREFQKVSKHEEFRKLALYELGCLSLQKNDMFQNYEQTIHFFEEAKKLDIADEVVGKFKSEQIEKDISIR